MGRIIVTNNRKWGNQLRNCYSKYGFSESVHDGGVTAYHKLYVENDNSIQKDGKLLICVGTWIYKECVGKEALSELFNDFVSENKSVKEIRKNLVGSYAVVKATKDGIQIFVDETHTYALYYYCNGKDYIISNTYYHIESCVKEKMDLDSVLISIAKVGFSSNRTIIKNIYRVMEQDVLSISDANFSITKTDLNSYTTEYKSENDIIKDLSEKIEYYAKVFSKQAKKRLLFCTGGADSRLKLSLDLYLGNDVEISYWKGEDCITNGTVKDTAVNKAISSKYKLKTHLFDVSQDFLDCYNNLDKNELEKYGEYAMIYGHNQKWLGMIDKIYKFGVDEIQMGCDPDILREIDGLIKERKDFYTLEDVICNGFLRSGLFKRVFENKKIIKLIEEDIRDMTDGFNLQRLSDDEISYIFNYVRLDMACIIPNFYNQYYYCLPLLHIKPIWDLIMSTPYKCRRDSKLTMCLINKWKNSLLDVPFFTHNHYAMLDKKNLLLKKTIMHSFLSWLKPKVIDTLTYDKIYLKYFHKKAFPEAINVEQMIMKSIKCINQSDMAEKLGLKIRGRIEPKGFDVTTISDVAIKMKFLDIIESMRS